MAQPNWEGKVCARLTNAKADQIWALYKDFVNFHKWFPSLATCYGIHGTNGEPGCIRYCAGFSILSDSAGTDKPVSRSKGRLTAVDNEGHSLSYKIVDINIGFESYISMVKIVPQGADGCVIECSFTVDPVEGRELHDLVKKYEVGLQCMAKRMEDALQHWDT